MTCKSRSDDAVRPKSILLLNVHVTKSSGKMGIDVGCEKFVTQLTAFTKVVNWFYQTFY